MPVSIGCPIIIEHTNNKITIFFLLILIDFLFPKIKNINGKKLKSGASKCFINCPKLLRPSKNIP